MHHRRTLPYLRTTCHHTCLPTYQAFGRARVNAMPARGGLRYHPSAHHLCLIPYLGPADGAVRAALPLCIIALVLPPAPHEHGAAMPAKGKRTYLQPVPYTVLLAGHHCALQLGCVATCDALLRWLVLPPAATRRPFPFWHAPPCALYLACRNRGFLFSSNYLLHDLNCCCGHGLDGSYHHLQGPAFLPPPHCAACLPPHTVPA